jgi:Reverse transcriptase (RNA-dependent DNA polymerase)
VLLHIAAILNWDVQHVNIKTAFLHSILPESETVFMEQPPGFEAPGKEDWVMRLLKSIYSMKQASCIWNQTFHKTIVSLGFHHLPCKWCIYRCQTPTGISIFAVDVDDIIVISSSAEENDCFKSQLHTKWEISDLGTVKYALGIAISRNRPTRTIHLSQTTLIDRIVDQFGQTDAHPVDTPMVASLQITCPDKSLPVPSNVAAWITRTLYHSLIGSLNYLAIATWPDIAFAVGRLATVLDCYRLEHWDAAVCVIRYLKGTRLLSLKLGGTNPIRPLGFSDSDYMNCPATSRSVTRGLRVLREHLFHWVLLTT